MLVNLMQRNMQKVGKAQRLRSNFIGITYVNHELLFYVICTYKRYLLVRIICVFRFAYINAVYAVVPQFKLP